VGSCYVRFSSPVSDFEELGLFVSGSSFSSLDLVAGVVVSLIWLLCFQQSKPPRAFPTSVDVVLGLTIVLKVSEGRVVVMYPLCKVVSGAVGIILNFGCPSPCQRVGVVSNQFSVCFFFIRSDL
jgi:hypothetical protein